MSEQVLVDAVVTHNEEKPSPLGPGFKRLTEQIYLSEAPLSPTSTSTDPTTILLYGWGDARPKHLAKYVDGYRALFPAAKLIVVLCPILRCLYQTLEARSKAMTPIISACFDSCSLDRESADGNIKSSTQNKNRILVQVMSNTGGMYFAATLNAYRLRFGQALPHHMLVLDSTPGSTSFLQNAGPWSRAMALGASGYLPGLPFVVTQAMACMFLAALHGFGWLVGASSAAAYSVAAVNNEELCARGARRLYLYSKEDDIIYWEDIERHAAQARQRGYQVDMDMFEGTPHVGHMRMHSGQYWGAVAKSWGEAVGGL